MKTHLQTKLNNPSTGRSGNCMATVIACWLDLEIVDVPNIETLFDIVEPKYFYYDVINTWLNSKGMLLRTADEFRCFHIETHIESETYKDRYGFSVSDMKHLLKDTFYLVSGVSPRNHSINHIVIYQNGKLYHDPHPEGGGIYVDKDQLETKAFSFQVIENI